MSTNAPIRYKAIGKPTAVGISACAAPAGLPACSGAAGFRVGNAWARSSWSSIVSAILDASLNPSGGSQGYQDASEYRLSML